MWYVEPQRDNKVPLRGAHNTIVLQLIWGKHAWLLYFAQMWPIAAIPWTDHMTGYMSTWYEVILAPISFITA